MAKYLYGASVQGIQDFIFKTNKLQEIVGASEIIKNIADDFTKNYQPDEILLNAAGNIKAIFSDKNECEKMVLEFGKITQQKAYGITISQVVVQIDDNYTQDDINNLERKLKIQRNKPSIPLDSSINIMKLNPTTAKPMIKNDQDMATKQKLEEYKNIKNKEHTDLHKLSNKKNKIAVIHIDGNGLGQLIPNLTIPLSEFSQKLDSATKKAFEDAKGDKKIREIILGGDDVTVICDPNDALSFTQEFLANFEKETKDSFSKLTACAGIAFCNEKYPFHYAVDLAETLCGVAKNDSNRESSCLMFHNIQSSNIQSWDKIVEDELTIKNDSETIRCDFGAYYLNKKDKPTIQNFINITESLRLKDSPSSKLRSWLSELYKSDTNAKNFLNRIDSMADENPRFKKILNENFQALDPKLKLNNQIVDTKVPIYDMLQILSTTTSYKGDTNDS
jgi:hypothetical protein